MTNKSPITDQDRAKFMELLLAASRAENGVLLTEWESLFLASYTHTQQYWRWFTDGRRQGTDNLWRKYGTIIGSPFPGAEVTAKNPVTIAAAADGCEFFVKLDGRQQRCNETAIYVNKNGFRYCGLHGDNVQRDLRRRGGHMELRAYP